MRNKYSNDNSGDDERQEIRSILEDLSKDIGKDWEKISDHAYFKTKYGTFFNILPKILDIFIELEKEWDLEEFKVNPKKFISSFESSYKYTPDFDLFRKFEVKDIKTVHQLNQFVIGHLISLIKEGGELITYLNLTEPSHDENNHLKNIIKLLALDSTRYLIKFTQHYKLLLHRDTRTFGADKLKKYPLIEDMATLQEFIIERNTLLSLLTIKTIKQDLFSFYNSLYINQDNWKEVQDLL